MDQQDYTKYMAEMAAKIKPADEAMASQEVEAEKTEKTVEKVVSGTVESKKPSLLGEIGRAFVGVAKETIHERIIPDAMDLAANAVHDMTDSIIYRGEMPRRRNTITSIGNWTNLTQYNRKYRSVPIGGTRPINDIPSRRYTGGYQMQDLIYATREDVEAVLANATDLCIDRGYVTVADIYRMSGMACTPTDNNWGWQTMETSGKRRLRDGRWVLVCTPPIAL